MSQLKSVTNKAEVIQILLSHLPLLRPGNEIAKHSYLQVLPQVLRYAIERSEYLEEVGTAFDKIFFSLLVAFNFLFKSLSLLDNRGMN